MLSHISSSAGSWHTEEMGSYILFPYGIKNFESYPDLAQHITDSTVHSKQCLRHLAIWPLPPASAISSFFSHLSSLETISIFIEEASGASCIPSIFLDITSVTLTANLQRKELFSQLILLWKSSRNKKIKILITSIANKNLRKYVCFLSRIPFLYMVYISPNIRHIFQEND